MRKYVIPAITMLICAGSLTACAHHHRTFGEKVQDTLDPPQGPAEKAGRSIDRATSD
ncbi:hypothetical protein [Kozakia baliensis]|uniref:hypothetical protein n=1 Tax=Kozakia baliensis TaxID=153496 RepID=UPI000A65A7C2|nr:hypothetical protein [Kozakia baliensis]